MHRAPSISTTAATHVATEEVALLSVARGLAEYHHVQGALLDPAERRSDAVVAGLLAERENAIAMIVRCRSRTRDELRRRAMLAATLCVEETPDLAAAASLALSIALDVDCI